MASVGTTGDSHDNALAEVFHSLFKAELVRNRDLWRELEEVEIAVAEYVDWFNHRRLHFQIGRWSRLGTGHPPNWTAPRPPSPRTPTRRCSLTWPKRRPRPPP
uniref:integrase core domain-containing protein n=1 Tax=Nocardiopsis salina TaxID=245836 RepID=UPI0013784BB3